MLLTNLRFLTQAETGTGGQAGAGKAAGIGQPAVSKILTQRTREPGYKTVLGLAQHFGVTVDDLLTRDLERDGPSVASQPTGLDVGKLANLIETVEGAIVDAKRPVPPRIKARLLTTLYADDRAAGASAEAIQRLLTSVFVSLEE